MLRKIRIIVGGIFLLMFTLIFVDFREFIPESYTIFFTSLQLVPAIMKIVAGVFTIGFIVLLVLPLLLGRIYCSTLCPLGVLQDLLSRLGKWTGWRKKYKFRKAMNIVRYGVLGCVALLFLLGQAFLLIMLDPYSIFGRTFSSLGRPLVVEVNNLAAQLLNKYDNYSLFAVDIPAPHWQAVIITVLLFVIVAWFSLRRGRLYCNTICPAGTLLGLLSRVSLFRIKFDTEKCTSCGKCLKGCKAECIDVKNKAVDVSRCVDCFNCIDACPENGIGLKYSFASKSTAKHTNSDRRKFFVRTFTGVASLSLISNAARSQGLYSNKGLTPLNRKHHASPPGSVSHEHFNTICTGCSLCVTACPTRVLQPAFLEYGIGGMMQPYMDFSAGLCNFDCVKCSEVCPAGAILKLSPEQKIVTQVGVAKFIKANCIVETEKTDCGACSEHCPTKAVNMVPYVNNLLIPEVKEEICVGCGACEYACPVEPFKSIYVDGHTVHKQAEKPAEEEIEVNMEEDFPF